MRFSRLLAPLLVVFSVVQAAHGDKSHPVTLTRKSPNTPQGMEGGFWRTDGHFDPVLRLKNVLLKQPLTVTPSLFLADGTE